MHTQTHTKPSKLTRRFHGFTLVELIVVITILVILGTIGFISISGFSGSARDSSRVSDLTNIAKGLDIVYIKTNSYPLPDSSFPVVYSGGLLWSQGNVGDGVMSVLSAGGAKINKKPMDPLYQTKEYTYSKTAYGNTYQIKSDWEGDSITYQGQNLFDQAYAATGNPTLTYTKGNYNGLVVKTITGSFVYVLAVPSIVTSQTGTLVDVLSLSGKLLMNGKTNSGGIAFTPSVVFSGASLPTNDTNSGITNLVITLQTTYSGSVIASDATIVKNLLSTTGSSNVLSLGSAIITSYLGGSTNIPVTVASSYNIGNSLLFDSSSSQYLSRTFGTPTSQNVWTYSAWVKKTDISSLGKGLFSAGNGTTYEYFGFRNYLGTADENFVFNIENTASNAAQKISSASFRDPSAYYHVVINKNGSMATSANSYSIYINNQPITSWSNSLNTGTRLDQINTAGISHYIGVFPNQSLAFFNGYLSDTYFIDGQAFTPSDFAQTDPTTGQWVPKQFTGDYGNNGFHLDFSSGASPGSDSSGKGNNWTTNGGITAVGNQVLDTPNNNFATLNALDLVTGVGGGIPVLSKGNLRSTCIPGNVTCFVMSSTIMPSTGKYYEEITLIQNPSGGSPYPTISSGKFYGNIGQGSLPGYGAGSILSLAHDLDSGKTWYRINGGSWQGGDPTTGSYSPGGFLSAAAPNSAFSEYTTHGGGQGGGLSSILQYNYGQLTFAYTPPTGFLALSTANLPAPAIMKPNQHFDVLTWTGITTASARTFTGLAFAPDFVWSKTRNLVYNHQLYDSVRGVGKLLSSNLTSSEFPNFQYGYLSSFNSDGFSTTPGSTDNENWNQINSPYVAWNWKAGGAAVTNNAGSITSQVSANPTAGFSIVSYTGTAVNATVGHGLGQIPKMVIVKNRTDISTPWAVWHSGIANTEFLYLNSTGAKTTGVNLWNSTSPTSTVLNIGNAQDTNYNTKSFIAYVFAEIPGYSKFGSYTGNGSTDGPFIHTGFRARYVMIKDSSNASAPWYIYDSARTQSNTICDVLQANSSINETIGCTLDFVSNGFKLRSTGAYVNGNGGSIIYAAFAEAPFKYVNAR